MIQEPLVRRTTVLLTIDLLDQVMGQLVLPMVEVSQTVTIKEAHRAGQATTTLQALVLRADQVLAVPQAPQVEVQADPQAAVAQEDPEEGGINSPFFLLKIYPKSDFASLTTTT